MDNYNYVVFGYDTDLYRIPYSDITKLDNAVYLYKPTDTGNALLDVLYKAHTTAKINRHIKLPFKEIWNGAMFRNRFDNDLPFCFIFFIRRCDLMEQNIIGYLRDKYKGSKFVCFYQDKVSRCTDYDLDRIKQEFDLILSFDQLDCRQYGLIYYPLVYSCVDIEEDDSIAESDVLFIGFAKNRYDGIISAYERLCDAGLKCDFHICGIRPEDRRYADTIDYCSPMPYKRNLQYIKSTRAMLEIMQKGGYGYTLRTCEAIVFGRRLITDNPEVSKAPFYSPELINIFSSPEQIDTDRIRSGAKDVDYGYKEQLSPIHLLEFIDRYFQNDTEVKI